MMAVATGLGGAAFLPLVIPAAIRPVSALVVNPGDRGRFRLLRKEGSAIIVMTLPLMCARLRRRYGV